jgi:regulatory protein
MEKKPALTPAVALKKAEDYCAYQERCQEEVRTKLYSYGLGMDDVEALLSQLIQSGFVNEERYAKAFCGGKFRQKKWGKVKIKQALAWRKISERLIRSALQEIDDEDYIRVIKEWIVKFKKQYKAPGLKEWQRKQKVIKALQAKGFESDLIIDCYEQAEA